MSTQRISFNPALDAEVQYRREVLMADAEHQRALRAVRGRGPGLLDRLLGAGRRAAGAGRRVVAARSAPVRVSGPTPLWR